MLQIKIRWQWRKYFREGITDVTAQQQKWLWNTGLINSLAPGYFKEILGK